MLTLFDKYAELLRRRFSEDFQEVLFSSIFNISIFQLLTWLSSQIVSTDDYMPMAINSQEEFDKVLNVSWYTPEQDVENIT